MIRSRSLTLLSLFCLLPLLLTSLAQAAPRYVDSPPLLRVIDTPVGEVQAGPLQLPVITWGGDIATIHANGDARTTASGSLFAQAGLDLRLVREDIFSEQVKAYLAGRSPFLRGTLGMINMAAERLAADPRTQPVILYQHTWSAGGDALVVKPGIHSATDLRGKTIALQAYGPHVEYMTKVLADAGLSGSDVTLRWLPDLTGSANTPMAALYEEDVDAAFVIIPDALALTSNGTVGTGAEDSIKGARILLSTKTANRIIADVYAVRADWFAANRDQAERLVQGLLQGQQALAELMRARESQGAEYRKMVTAAAEMLFDSAQAVADVEGLYSDAEFVGYNGNREFFANPNYPRNLDRLTREAQSAFQGIGLMSAAVALKPAGWDYDRLRSALSSATVAPAGMAGRFDQAEVASVVARRQQQGTLGEGELFSFEIFFQPNQNDFSPDLYRDSFARVVDLASTYGGAIITVEGHSDPMGYLREKNQGSAEVVLGRIKQSARNLSLSRAVAVRDSLVGFAATQGVALDPSQFAVIGHGISAPKSGVCGSDPCAPKSEREWRDNMRVVFRIVQIEAESSLFRPL